MFPSLTLREVQVVATSSGGTTVKLQPVTYFSLTYDNIGLVLVPWVVYFAITYSKISNYTKHVVDEHQKKLKTKWDGKKVGKGISHLPGVFLVKSNTYQTNLAPNRMKT